MSTDGLERYAFMQGAHCGYHGAGKTTNPYRYGPNWADVPNEDAPQDQYDRLAEVWDTGWRKGHQEAK